MKSEASEKEEEEIQRLGHKIIIGPWPLGGARRVRPPGSASENMKHF